MAVVEKLPAKDCNPPIHFSKRWIFAYIGICGVLLRDSIRFSMSVAIVCMVRDGNSTAVIAETPTLPGDSSNGTTSEGPSEFSQETKLPLIRGAFDWDKPTQSIVLSSFFYGYLVTQIPGGWLATRFGGKIVVGTAMLVGSIATLLTPAVAYWDYRALAVLRAVAGLFQAVMTPAMQSILGRWSPKPERSRLFTFVASGGTLGYITTYTLAGLLCTYDPVHGWAYLFYSIGIGGLIWTALWLYIVSDTPDSHPTISKAERDYIVNSVGKVQQKALRVPWMSMLKSCPLLVTNVAYICGSYMSYTMALGLPTFMNEVLHFDILENGILTSVPYLVMSVTTLCIGHVADFLTRKYMSNTHTRKLIQITAFSCNGGCVVAMGFVSRDQRALAVVLMTMAMGFDGLSYSGYVVNLMELAPRYAGVAFGIANTIGTIPGIIAPNVIGLLTPNKSQAEWRNVFYVSAGFCLLGAIVFGCFAQGEIQSWAVEEREVVVTPPHHHGDDRKRKGAHNLAFDVTDERMPDVKLTMDSYRIQSTKM